MEGLASTFWSHVPRSLAGLLFSQAVVSVVALCDSVLYKAAVKSVLPSPSLPGSLASAASSSNYQHFQTVTSPGPLSGSLARSSLRL